MSHSLLQTIHCPADLRLLNPSQLSELAAELRSFILDVVSANPGHLGASLGVVELSIALHYLFDTPDDVLVWDVGHQAYGHKILTGRREQFETLRKWQGISGFPVITESRYDAFGTGHASTGLSAALGMAVASALKGETSRKHVVVVGDGAMTGGMFFEALNQAGDANVNLLIVLNDNGISIDKSAGALKDYLAQQRKKPNGTNNSPLFDAFGITTYGPVDGNDLEQLLRTLGHLKSLNGVHLLHVVTTKGKGFARAEQEQVLFHAPGTFDRLTGHTAVSAAAGDQPLYQHVFGQTLTELAVLFPNITGITPAMPTGSSLNIFMDAFPDRAFDVDIAEQHALTFAAGQAIKGLKPFCVVYSTFLQRAYDQLIHDIALQNLPVVLCVDRAGLVGEDGATHQGAFDMTYLRCIPNLIIAAPMDGTEMRNLMFSAATAETPFVIRYPRGKTAAPWHKKPFEAIETGRGRKLRAGQKVAVISIGHPGNFVSDALDSLENEGLFVSHYDLRFLKPLDDKLLHEAFTNHALILTVEDGVVNGGMGSAILEWANDQGYRKPITRLGIPDHFVQHGSPAQQYAHCGFDTDGIRNTLLKLLKS